MFLNDEKWPTLFKSMVYVVPSVGSTLSGTIQWGNIVTPFRVISQTELKMLI